MIYLVEDDESIRELVVYTLKSQGLDAKGFERISRTASVRSLVA